MVDLVTSCVPYSSSQIRKMIFEYELHDFTDWLNQYAKAVNSVVEDGYMAMPPDLADGYVYAGSINEDMSYSIQHFRLKKSLTLKRKKTVPYALTLFFNNVEVEGAFKISTEADSILDESRYRNNIFLSSTNYDLEFTHTSGSYIRRVGICFSESMLRKYIRKDILLDVFMYTGLQLNNVNREIITLEYKNFLQDIFNTDPRSPLSKLILQNRVLFLIELFFQSFLKKMEQDASLKRKVKHHDIEGLQMVEKILSEKTTEKFPSVEELSKTAMMSTTKLKNRFKEVYGMKLYEFYNRNRLKEARDLIESGKYSIKEAGYKIGFTNLSNFSKAFRKEFGLLPSKLK